MYLVDKQVNFFVILNISRWLLILLCFCAGGGIHHDEGTNQETSR